MGLGPVQATGARLRLGHRGDERLMLSHRARNFREWGLEASLEVTSKGPASFLRCDVTMMRSCADTRLHTRRHSDLDGLL